MEKKCHGVFHFVTLFDYFFLPVSILCLNTHLPFLLLCENYTFLLLYFSCFYFLFFSKIVFEKDRSPPCHIHPAHHLVVNPLSRNMATEYIPVKPGHDEKTMLSHHCLNSKLWYLQHSCVGDTIVYDKDSNIDMFHQRGSTEAADLPPSDIWWTVSCNNAVFFLSSGVKSTNFSQYLPLFYVI